jgi:NADPH-dependent 2,4-dienoyl-CoA reductase/sulfur reductase-like enzyme
MMEMVEIRESRMDNTGIDELNKIIIIGGGYSGVLLGSILAEKGFRPVILDSFCKGGEIGVFSKLKVLREHYSEFIEEYETLLPQLQILKTTVLKVEKGENWKVKTLESETTSERVFLCTGCYDVRPYSCKIFGTRPAGIFTLQNALELISRGYRIGKNVLLYGKDKILEIVEEMMRKEGYDCQVVEGREAEVFGVERVEGVEVDDEIFKCDTLIHFCGREEFNPLGLEGIKAGNINSKTYDYEKVRKDVLKTSKIV